MYTTHSLFLSVKNTLNTIALPLLLLMMVVPSVRADLIIEYDVIASGATVVPGGNGGTFSSLGGAPAIDNEGNVAFTGLGGGQFGVYSYIGGDLQRVADYDTPVPGGGGATFSSFFGEGSVDIDGGRVAFLAVNQFSQKGLYSNVGQASPADLVEIAVIDGVEWAAGGLPWVDRDVVGMTGERLVPSRHDTILRWDGPSLSKDYVDLGAGFSLAGNVEASISGATAIFPRMDPNVYELDISNGGEYEALAVADVTPMPGRDGVLISYFSATPVVDRGGLDVAFASYGSDSSRAVIKRVNGGALQNVADTLTEMPGSNGIEFGMFIDNGVALANGQVVLHGVSQFFRGLYTDIGGVLSVIVDNENNALIELDGRLEEVHDVDMGTRAFAFTPQGYMLVFRANLVSGETVIIRATITDPGGGGDLPGVDEGSPPTEDFESGSAAGWLLDGDVAIDANLAMGQYSLRHANSATSMLSVSTAGYEDISVTMHLAATSLKKRDGCFAEVSTDGGNSWLPVIEVHDGNDDGTFYSGTVYPPGADDNSDLQLRFRASGKSKKGNCYGDNVTVLGTPVGGVEYAP